MSSESKVGGLPPLPDIGPEGWYTRTDMIAYAIAALSAHGQPVVDEALADENDRLRTALSDLLTWFPEKPSHEWRLQAGERGADDAIAAARAALTAALEGAAT